MEIYQINYLISLIDKEIKKCKKWNFGLKHELLQIKSSLLFMKSNKLNLIEFENQVIKG